MGNCISGNNRRNPAPTPAPTPAQTPSATAASATGPNAVHGPGAQANAAPQAPNESQRQAEAQVRQSQAAAARDRVLTRNQSPAPANNPAGARQAASLSRPASATAAQRHEATIAQWQAWAQDPEASIFEQRSIAARVVGLCTPTTQENLILSSLNLAGELPPLPQHIRGLNTNDNPNLTSLPPLPAGLRRLHASGCGLQQFPAFPEGSQIEELRLTGNARLTALPAIAPSLNDLDASGCGLVQLPEFPNNSQMRALNVSGNPLEQLRTLPARFRCLRLQFDLVAQHACRHDAR